ncbi:5-aminolevulinate synthase [Xylariaceae sp. FL0662B]|nr:5-aminolevulinate synthase [Xylariaceae sp. FL0662B]
MSSPEQVGVKFLANWVAGQQPKAAEMKDAPTFDRNLENALDTKRESKSLVTRIKAIWKTGDGVDFSSNDLLSLGSTGRIRGAFLEELASNPSFPLYSGGSRLMDGNYDYVEDTENMIAEFHKADTGLIMNSGYNGNLAIYSSLPLADDVVLYDELTHMSTHDGMAVSASKTKLAFRHNDVESLRETLQSVLDTHPKIRDGSNSVLISVESVYSVDGDVCPLREMVRVAREVCTNGNVVFIVDEAHATGVVGPKGAGLVNHLGMEKDIAIRLHTCGKALASSGAIILGNSTVRAALLNYAHPIIYTTAPSFHSVAGMRAAYNILSSGATQDSQIKVQHLVLYFFQVITSNTIWDKANAMGILFIPVISEGWQNSKFHAHIVPVWTRQKYTWWLLFHLLLSHISAQPVDYPSVPKEKKRIRIIFHAANTEGQVQHLADTLCDFAREMINIEENGEVDRVPQAAQQVYALIQGNS